MKYFDYVFFRIHSYYVKKRYMPIIMGIGFLVVLKYCLLFLFATIINMFTDNIISATYIDRRTFYFFYWSIIIVFLIVDIFRYGGREKVSSYRELFKQSSLNSKIPTWLIFMQPLVFILLSILFNELVRRVMNSSP